MYNHHLLQITSRPAWLTIRNGAIQYINSVTSKCKHIYLNTPVTKVFRQAAQAEESGTGDTGGTAGTGKVVVVSSRGDEVFDHVIFATHADTALELLEDANALEREILGSFEFSENVATLHSDLNVPPQSHLISRGD